MRKKLLGYSLVSFLSFWFFLTLFITGVSAQVNFPQPSIFPSQAISSIPSQSPSPVIDPEESDPQPTVYLVPGEDQPAGSPQAQWVDESIPIPPPAIYLIPNNPPSSAAFTAPAITVDPDLDSLFTTYSNMYNVNKYELLKIARCESNFHNQSVNGTYVGMFQFGASTWMHVRSIMGLDTSLDLRTNAEESIRTASYWIANGHLAAWSCR